MGAWGCQPKDNDGAWDLADTALAEAEKWLAARWDRLAQRAHAQANPDARGFKSLLDKVSTAWRRADALFVRAGAVQILLERGVLVRRGLVEDAAKDLRAVLQTPEYMRGWCDPGAARRSIHRILVAMEGLLKEGYWRRARGKSRSFVSADAYEKLSAKQRVGLRFVPAPHILAPVGWPRKDAGKRSWTEIERCWSPAQKAARCKSSS